MKDVLIYAHRGASHSAPENTISAFKKAIELGADGIEFDVQLTRDNKVVVIHDEQLGRTCSGLGTVKDLDMKYLKTLDFGSWFSNEFAGEKIPLLDEVLDQMKDTDMMLNIEIKAMPGLYNENIEKALNDVIKNSGKRDNIIVSSFNHYSLEKIKALNSQISIAPLYVSMIKDIYKYAKKIKADHIHPLYLYLTKEIVEECSENHIYINTWTVDDGADMKKIIEMGVFGIVTNRLDIAKDLLRDMKRGSYAL